MQPEHESIYSFNFFMDFVFVCFFGVPIELQKSYSKGYHTFGLWAFLWTDIWKEIAELKLRIIATDNTMQAVLNVKCTHQVRFQMNAN